MEFKFLTGGGCDACSIRIRGGLLFDLLFKIYFDIMHDLVFGVSMARWGCKQNWQALFR